MEGRVIGQNWSREKIRTQVSSTLNRMSSFQIFKVDGRRMIALQIKKETKIEVIGQAKKTSSVFYTCVFSVS